MNMDSSNDTSSRPGFLEFSWSILQNSTAATFVLDIDHTVIFWNHACELLTGVSAQNVLGTHDPWKGFYQYARPCLADIIIDGNRKDLPQLYALSSSSRISEGALHGEGWFTGLNGLDRYLVFDAAPVITGGTLSAVVETVFDMTEQKHAERALRSLAEFEKLISAISTNFINRKSCEVESSIGNALEYLGRFSGVDSSSIYLFSEDGAVMRRAYNWLVDGITSLPSLDSCLKTSCFPLFMQRIRRSEVVNIADVRDLSAGAYAEQKVLLQAGIRSLIAVPMVYGGKVAGFLEFSAFRSEKRWNEEDIKLLRIVSAVFVNALERMKSEQAIRAAAEKYRTIFENTGSAMLIVEKDQVISLVNAEFERMSGYSREEIENKKTFADFLPEEDLQRIHLFHRLRREAPERAPGRYEARLLGRSGKIRSMIVTATLFPGMNKTLVSLNDISLVKQAEERLRQSYERLLTLFDGIINAIVKIVETRDPYTAGHEKRVAELAVAIAVEMGLPDENIKGLRMAAVIHDIGKIYVPSEILSKPGFLSEIELNIIRIHPRASFDILKVIDFPWPVADIVYQHQERYDGSGYPQGLKGKDIILEARIISVADVVEAMTFARPYRPAIGIDKALDEVISNKGILYDPEAVDACLRLFKIKGFKFKEQEPARV